MYNVDNTAKKGFYLISLNGTFLGVIHANPKMIMSEGEIVSNEVGDEVVTSYIVSVEFEDLQVTKANYEWLRTQHGLPGTLMFTDINTNEQKYIENAMINIKLLIEGNALNKVSIRATANSSSDDMITFHTPAPEISISPLSIDFGEVTEAETSDGLDYFTISNIGDTVLSIGHITMVENYEIKVTAGGSWTILNDPFDIPAYSSADIYVRVTPPAVATYAGNLVVASNDSDEPTVNIAVTVDGISATPVLPVDYIAMYKMDDNAANTTVTDETGNFSLLSNSNTNTISTTGAKGVANTAFEFNGSSDWLRTVTLPLDQSYFSTTGNCSISMQLYIPEGTTYGTVFAWNNSGGDPYFGMFARGEIGNKYLQPAHRVGGTSFSPLIAITTDTWISVIITITNGEFELFIDNVSAGTETISANLYGINVFNIGRFESSWYGSAMYFSGSIDNFRIYGYSLTLEQRTAIYDAEKP